MAWASVMADAYHGAGPLAPDVSKAELMDASEADLTGASRVAWQVGWPAGLQVS